MDETWETRDRKKIAVGDMTEAHVRNTLRMIEGRAFRGGIDKARNRLRSLIRDKRFAQARVVFANNPFVDI